ncbi:MAG TPA: hypothetical protein VMW52_12300 [Phycisphaerae bacterium]|nr:hypothetical protein [Phycisphaerae bacterium]
MTVVGFTERYSTAADLRCQEIVRPGSLDAAVSIRRAWRLNAMFEDHAEHTFMQFVEDNPQMENETPQGTAIQDGRGPDQGRYASWADVFRRIGLDERDHMNESLRRCGMADRVVPYADEPA